MLIVKLEFLQLVKVGFNEPNRIIKDQVVGWNFLTGMIIMSLKNALFYNLLKH